MRGERQTDSGGEAGGPPVRDHDGRVRVARLSARGLALIVAACVVALDQLTKLWVLRGIADNPIVLIDGFLQLRITRNTGAAFSLFVNSGPLLAVVASIVVVAIYMSLGDTDRRLEAVALGLILGGAVGNLIDRMFRGDGFLDGAVIDFIDFSFFPSFNVADSAITIGVALLLLAGILRSRRGE